MSLADRFGRAHRTLRLGLTERCNLRCTYCMPAEGIPLTPTRAMLTTDEIERLARLLVGAGVDKVRLTGGEPLVRKDAVEVAERLGRLGLRALAITTNGLLLEDRLPALRAAGLTDVTVSLDTLRADRFLTITRRPGLDRVLSALDAALSAGYGVDGPRSLKVNVVALRGVNEDEAADLAGLAAQAPIEVRFIEVMPFDGNGWDRAELVPWTETKAAIEAAHGPLLPRADGPSSTSRTFERPGWRGSTRGRRLGCRWAAWGSSRACRPRSARAATGSGSRPTERSRCASSAAARSASATRSGPAPPTPRCWRSSARRWRGRRRPTRAWTCSPPRTTGR